MYISNINLVVGKIKYNLIVSKYFPHLDTFLMFFQTIININNIKHNHLIMVLWDTYGEPYLKIPIF